MKEIKTFNLFRKKIKTHFLFKQKNYNFTSLYKRIYLKNYF